MGANTNTSRRALLGGAGLVASATVIGIMPAARATTGISPALAALIAEAERCERVAATYEQTVFEPAYARYREIEAATPHGTVPNPSGFGMWTTRDKSLVNVAESWVRSRPRASAGADGDTIAYHRGCRSLLAASKRRECSLQRARRSTGLQAACERSDQLGDENIDAEDAVLAFEAVTMADAAAKLAFAERRLLIDEAKGQCYPHVALSLLRDLRALTTREA